MNAPVRLKWWLQIAPLTCPRLKFPSIFFVIVCSYSNCLCLFVTLFLVFFVIGAWSFFHETVKAEKDNERRGKRGKGRWSSGVGGGGGVLLDIEKDMGNWCSTVFLFCLLFMLLLLLFSRWIVNELTFCGNGNLSRNTTDGIDYNSCPNRSRNCNYTTPFWGQASSIVS